MIKLGLTGSIGMGKSTTASIFAQFGVPVWDADAAVARAYGENGAAVGKIAELLPDCVSGNAVDRAKLRAAVTADPSLIKALELIVHPIVGQDRAEFLAKAAEKGEKIALCDIPLLFETGAEAQFDLVVVVSAPADIQRERVLARPGISEQTFETILAKQMADSDKRARADYIIDTGNGLEAAKQQVEALVKKLRAG